MWMVPTMLFEGRMSDAAYLAIGEDDRLHRTGYEEEEASRLQDRKPGVKYGYGKAVGRNIDFRWYARRIDQTLRNKNGETFVKEVRMRSRRRDRRAAWRRDDALLLQTSPAY